MKRFVVSGGKKLFGSIDVSGSKNAALPILFATIITHGVSVIRNLPDIKDVRITVDILTELGASVKRVGKNLIVDTRVLHYTTPSEALVRSIRASSYLLGAMSARFGRARIMPFGGCNFDSRPIDMHVGAMRRVGVRISDSECVCDRLMPADIVFDRISVGATVNALLLTATAVGHSRIFGYAREPHVYSLIDYLNSAGASISITPEYISVFGRELFGGEAFVIPDMIEAGTYIAIALATDSQIKVCDVRREHLLAVTELFSSTGAGFLYENDSITPFGTLLEYTNVYTSPHPGFPTDLQPIIAPLLALCAGGRICEGVWRGRFGYLTELSKFGLSYSLSDSAAEIYKSHLKPARVSAPDLRGGAALLVAALAASGESEVFGADMIGRGYEGIAGKLRSVGAEISEVD